MCETCAQQTRDGLRFHAIEERLKALEARPPVVVSPCQPLPWPFAYPWQYVNYCNLVQANQQRQTAKGTYCAGLGGATNV
jgi:hypothetical protein